jgi:hypothetical protein
MSAPALQYAELAARLEAVQSADVLVGLVDRLRSELQRRGIRWVPGHASICPRLPPAPLLLAQPAGPLFAAASLQDAFPLAACLLTL